MIERDEVRALLLEMEAAPFKVTALDGKRSGLADLTLRLPVETVRRFWSVAKELAAEGGPAPGPTEAGPVGRLL